MATVTSPWSTGIASSRRHPPLDSRLEEKMGTCGWSVIGKLLYERHPAGFNELIAKPEAVNVSAAGHSLALGVCSVPGSGIDPRSKSLVHQDFYPLPDEVVDHQLS